MSQAKPALPPRNRGVHSQPQLPSRVPVVPVATRPTQPFKQESSKPVLPPRVPLRANGPSLPSRDQTTFTVHDQKYCGRRRSPKYEDRNFSTVDDYVRALPEYETPRELSYALTCNFPDTVDKYRAIFCWIAFNVAYDAVSFLSNAVPPQSAKNTFQTRLAVCAGYAQLFQKLCEKSDLHCVEISGYAKGFGFDPSKTLTKGSNHLWNAVYVEGEWRMIDVTWGAGNLTDRFNL